MPASVLARGGRRHARRSLRLVIGLAVLAAMGAEPALSTWHGPVLHAALAAPLPAPAHFGTHFGRRAQMDTRDGASGGHAGVAGPVNGWPAAAGAPDRVLDVPATVPAMLMTADGAAPPPGAGPAAAPGRRAPPPCGA